ncbi:putative metallo-beta-lactamase domain protein [Coniochaeta sp. 2T2.1]|nr:putative metallo-beta-lactamase domain protein [Coniochaeta sp. 2T2.1]
MQAVPRHARYSSITNSPRRTLGLCRQRTRTAQRHLPTTAPKPIIHDVFESTTGTWQYVVADPSTSAAVIIDPVLDYDPVTQAVSTTSADALLALVADRGYRVDMILETHAHADHFTAASYLQSRLAKPPIGIGRRIGTIQSLFGQRYGVPAAETESVFDKLFDDNEVFRIGSLEAVAVHLPGHTPDHMGYRIGDNVFCGDSIFVADIGTARCDFPGGSADDLFDSGRRLLDLPSHVKIWTGHDYPPDRAPISCMSVEQHRMHNKHLKDGTSKQDFVAVRTERDSSLAAPRLLHQSLQFNIRGGRLPRPTVDGYRMLHLPLRVRDVW